MPVLAHKKYSNCTVYLTHGKAGGEMVWHYVKVDMLKLPLFRKALKSGTLKVSKYGEILFSGWGKNPPDEIRAKVEALYGE